jgi:hypothetical protein
LRCAWRGHSPLLALNSCESCTRCSLSKSMFVMGGRPSWNLSGLMSTHLQHSMRSALV